MDKESKIPVSFRLGYRKREKLKVLVEDTDESLSDIVNHAVTVYLKMLTHLDKLEENSDV